MITPSRLAVASLLLAFAGARVAFAITSILITNDDGPGGPGLQALVTEIKAIPDTDVKVVVPAQNASGTGAGITFNATFTVTPDVPLIGGADTAYTVSSNRPADCVRWAVQHLYGGALPDYVLSGINQGQNVGPAFGSGTVGAALQGQALGARAIAFSQGITLEPPVNLGTGLGDYTDGATFAGNLVQAFIAGDPRVEVLETHLRRGGMLNIQIPPRSPVGVRLTRAADITELFGPTLVDYMDQGGGQFYAAINLDNVDSFSPLALAQGLKTDAGALARNFIVIARWFPLDVARKPGGPCCDNLLP
jgi:5'-nucleotidase